MRMPPGPHPVFHDPSGRRRRWTLRIAVGAGAVFLVIAAVFLVSLVAVPALPPTAGLSVPMRRALRPHLPERLRTETRLERFLLQRERRRLLEAIAHEQRLAKTRAGLTAAAGRGTPIVAAFYATWQETGLHSLRAHAEHITHLMPLWLRIGADGASLDSRDWNPEWTPHNRDVLRIVNEHHIRVMPVLSNAHEGQFDTALAHRLLTHPEKQRRLALDLADWLARHHFAGVNVDLENLDAADVHLVPPFLVRLTDALHRRGLQVSADLEVEGNVPDAGAMAKSCDFVVLMAYDEHYVGAQAGPLCDVRWFAGALDRTLARVPADKLVLGIGNYAYDWTGGRAPADILTYQEALYIAADNHPEETPAQVVDFDSLAFNPTFQYDDEHDRGHEVWMLDAVTAANQRLIASQHGVRNVALWSLGSEDPAVWSVLDRNRPDAPPESLALAHTSFPYDVEFQGDGELLTVAALPQAGVRRLERDPSTGLFADETYERYPTSYLIQRRGFLPKSLALTFDDGPSTPYTARLLDTMRELRVPGTFFVIGENAERHPDLIQRIWDEGDELGNHTYTHPNIAAASVQRASFELNATQRVLQSTLGRSTLMFRPPYNADAEPTSAEEVRPMLEAAKLGYFTVGEYLDPQDWRLRDPDGRPRTAGEIADRVVELVHAGHGSTILLHDGGGDRSATLAALKLFVPRLRAEGYRFVTVSELAGTTRDKVMPPVSARDRALMGGDRLAFYSLYVVQNFLRWAFLAGIALGAARVVWMSVLALVAWRRERRRRFEDRPPPPISVLIAAYNEQPVVARTIAAVLASTVAPLEVIVVDDGSTDDTAGAVERAFAGEPRVRLVRQANGGKAAALNRAIGLSRGEVLICLDADTLFTPATIGNLVRHFGDATVGAVAGNCKVGNRVNVWTRWQALEYITSQNLDRRAYALLNAITVVPGAVGAWRRAAVEQAGGFRSDTLAEDMDLTWRIRRAGWRIENDSQALGFTETPDSLTTLYRQRFRWTFGTLQCLWKHRDAVGRYGWFGRLALPTLWLFQIAFQILSPIIDLEIAWTLALVAAGYFTRAFLTQDWQPLPQAVEALSTVGFLYLFFFLLELMGASIAVALDREKKRLLWWLFWQRFVYRQVMYAVVWRSLRTAVVGHHAGWGKLERKGTATVEAPA
jgi:cellulose synthase/poly-beta-1,6-N-acetylglucosamine synthase-like glycosyltransferase/peptidoglycan/xylan/chitin deacetylase (PgdA/CDA1 family)/spore germination protein YaaH